MKRFLFLIIFTVIIFETVFCLNKIRYRDFDWYIYETNNFYIYYYKDAEFLAKIAAIYAEQAYSRLSSAFGFKSKEKIPLFIYDSHQAFTTTNVTLSFLGEGTGGFTEPFKNRIALPGNGSLKAFREVIIHEIVHAFQFNIIYGEGMRSYTTLYKDLFIPLWVMEGQAEYFADDFDTIGDMILRDAVINNRLIPLDKLEGFNHLEEVYLAYKEAQSVFMYIANRYGEDKIPEFIKLFNNELGIDGIFKKVLKKDINDFKKEWEFYLKKKYWTHIQGRDMPEKYGPKLTDNNHQYIVYNQAPVFSPDGSKIAFISSKSGNRAIYVMRNDGRDLKEVFSNRFEGIAVDGFPLSWASDNKTLFFVSKERGIKYIFKGNIETEEIEKIVIPEFDNLFSPAISPDGKYLAFTAIKDGFSDIYIYNLENKEVINITKNVFANNYPTWSFDGTAILFTEERNEHNRIIYYNLKTGEKKFITKAVTYDYLSPRFLNDKEIVCISDKNGIYNIWKIDLKNGNEQQLTNVINGIFSVSACENYLTYAYYEDACYNIYKYLLVKKQEFVEIPLIYSENILKEKQISLNRKFNFKKNFDFELKVPEEGDDKEFRNQIENMASKIIKNNQKYSLTFTPDMLFALIGFSTETGPIGGAYLLLSDMLGDNNLSLLANFIPGFYSQFDFSYLYLKLPFDVWFNFFYHQNIYQLYDLATGTFFSQLDITEIGGNLLLNYPLNLYANLGLNLSAKRITDKYTNYDKNSSFIFNDNETNILNTLTFYFVNDFTFFRDFWAFSGDLFLVYIETADKIFGGTKTYTIYEIDLKKHFDLSSLIYKNLSFSFRILGAMTEGVDRPYFLFGGINTVRGLRYGEYKGDKVILTNYELRYTLVKNLNFQLWPLTFLMFKNIKISLFDDAGIVKTGPIDRISGEEIKNGLGIGFIFDTFIIQRQYVPLRFDFARRTDTGDETWKFYFSFNIGW